MQGTGTEDGVADRSTPTHLSSDSSETESTEDEGSHDQDENNGYGKKERTSVGGSSVKTVSGEQANNQSVSGKDSLYKSDDGAAGLFTSMKEGNRSTSRKRTKSGRYTSDITLEEMQGYFHLPAYEAARRMGIGLTILKRLCRKFGVQRWPYQRKRFSDMKEEELLEQAQVQVRQQTVPVAGAQEPPRSDLHNLVEQLLVMLGNQRDQQYAPAGYGPPGYQGGVPYPGPPPLPPHMGGPSPATMVPGYFPPQDPHMSALFSALKQMDQAQINPGSIQAQQSEHTEAGNYLQAVQECWKRQHTIQLESRSAFRPFSDILAAERPGYAPNGELLSFSGCYGGTSAEEFKNRNFAGFNRNEEARQ